MEILHGFAISNFRSFKDTQYFGPLSRLNVLAGANNSGKSNAVLFLRKFRELGHGVDPLDVPLEQDSSTPYGFSLAVPISKILDEFTQRSASLARRNDSSDRVRHIFRDSGLLDEHDLVWIPYELTVRADSRSIDIDKSGLAVADGVPAALVGELAKEVLSQWSSDSNDNLYNLLRRIVDPLQSVPPVETVLPVRQVSPADETQFLISTIDDWRNPPPGREAVERQRKYDALNKLVRRVTSDESAEILVPTSKDTVIVRTATRALPLENLGTGTHQLIFLAVAATRQSGRLICIEEEEVHMHPMMQRRFLEFLRSDTSNQYIITTHSAMFLNDRYASVFSVSPSSTGTSVSRASRPNDLVALTQDLGYRASDLIQSNYVVWVEGPSDRIYINFWLSFLDPELIEGVHYSIMFYGGALLPHLSASESEAFDEEELEEFVALCRLNRYFTVVIDSDRRGPDDSLSSAKQRIKQEVQVEPRADCWITAGYTIENYVPRDLMHRAVATCHPKVQYKWRGGKFTNPLGQRRFHKVRIARVVVGYWREVGTPLSDDLLEPARRLAANIRECQVPGLMSVMED